MHESPFLMLSNVATNALTRGRSVNGSCVKERRAGGTSISLQICADLGTKQCGATMAGWRWNL
jgi:hypothetical protein